MFGDDTNLNIIIRAKDEASKIFNNISEKVSDLKSHMESAKGVSQAYALALGAVSVAGGKFIGTGVRMAADLETAEIGLKTLLGSAEKASATVARIKKEAARTPFEIKGLTEGVQLLSSVTKDGDKAIDIILNIGEGLAAMGKGQVELDRIIVNLQQIASVGKASLVDIKQFAFAGIPIYEMLAETTGKTGEELSKLIENGGITFDVLTKMFDEANNSGGKFFNAFVNQSGSFNQSLSNLKDSWNIFLSDLVTNTGIFDILTNAITKLTASMVYMEGFVKGLIEYYQEHKLALAIVAGAILGGLIPAVYAAVAAFVAWGIAMAPFFAAGAVIGAVIWGINWLIQNFDMLKEKVIAVWQQITSWIGENIEKILVFLGPAGLLTAGIVWLVKNFDQVKTATKSMWEGISEAFKTGVNFILGLAEAMANGWVMAINVIIKALNSLSISIPEWVPGVGGKSWGVNIPTLQEVKLARLEHGGRINAPIGQAVPIIAHGQETIIPAKYSQNQGKSINIVINNPVVRNQNDIYEIKKQLDMAMRSVMLNNKI